VHIPPLRQRRDDVPLLAEHFLARFHRGARPRRFSDEALATLRGHEWPFNVRELQMVVESAVCLSDRDVLGPEDLPAYLRGEVQGSEPARPEEAGTPPRAMREVLDEAERRHIVREPR
jgi:DNA-binding NtrC family response regulator